MCKDCINIDEQGSIKIKKDSAGIILSENKSAPINITNKIPFQNEQFDYVTMVAVIEHLKNPKEVIDEINRILKPNGLLIITTPFPVVEKILFFLDRGSDQLRGKSVEEEHENYFNLKSMDTLTEGLFKIKKYKRFQLGVNQLFIYRKI
ncbi:class I SAM-dependent methyltransferase [Candidatus Woesearchaeota archaeon]|nr:class I SAM-dependent methyltransferase [Candidatus Woesearchaeota archaeon]